MTAKILIVTAILFICAAAVEVGVRIMGVAPSIDDAHDKFLSDPHLPWRVKPDWSMTHPIQDGASFTYTYNSRGFRDEEHSLEKPAGVYRIVALGDSFTHGTGADYEETYLVKLERALNELTGGKPKVEIIKMGVSGYWTAPERLMLEHYGLAYSPDLVIVGFLQNDIIDTQTAIHKKKVEKGYIVSQEGGLGDLGMWFYLNSEAMRILLSKYAEWKKSRTGYLDWEVAWRQILEELGKVVELGNSAPAPAITVVFHISQKTWAASGMEDHQLRLDNFCRENGCVFIDSVDELRKQPYPKDLYWQINGHCTPAGYAVMANALLQVIIEHNLVPGL